MKIIVKGSDMSVAEAAREGRLRSTVTAMEDCISRWARNNPQAVVDLQNQVKGERQHLYRDDGYSRTRDVRKRGQIPVKLFHMIQKEVDRNWLWDPHLRKMFWKIFKIGLVNPRADGCQ